MDRQPRLVIQCKNLVIAKSNILCNYNCFFGCPQHFLVHKLRHLPIRIVRLMFFVISWNCSNNDLKNSYSRMGEPFCSKCKIVANSTTL